MLPTAHADECLLNEKRATKFLLICSDTYRACRNERFGTSDEFKVKKMDQIKQTVSQKRC